MSDTLPENLVPLRDLCDRVPGHRRGARTHISTLIRHATEGVKTPGGARVKLRAVRFGHRWLTTEEWFAGFVRALTTGAAPETDSAQVRSPAARRRGSEAAERELIARGA